MTNVTKSRPLSPHLQIYKPIPTMVMSIIHRITGGALYFGTMLVAWWLIAAATGPEYYDWVNWCLRHASSASSSCSATPGRCVHHLLGGLRHFMWDLGLWLREALRHQARHRQSDRLGRRDAC